MEREEKGRRRVLTLMKERDELGTRWDALNNAISRFKSLHSQNASSRQEMSAALQIAIKARREHLLKPKPRSVVCAWMQPICQRVTFVCAVLCCVNA